MIMRLTHPLLMGFGAISLSNTKRKKKLIYNMGDEPLPKSKTV